VRSSRFRFPPLLPLVLLAAACVGEPPTHPAAPARALTTARAGRYVPGRLLVRFRPGADRATIASTQGAALGPTVALGIQQLSVPIGRELVVAARLRARGGVEFAEPDWLRTLDDPLCPTCTLPDDAFFGYKWDLHNDGTINSSTGQALATTGRIDADMDWLEAFDLLGSGFTGTARVAILDTGIRATHEDLAGRIVAQYDFVNGDPDASDDQGHGTHVAGIAAARGDDSRGLTGVAYGPGIGIMAAKVCTPTSFGLNADCPSSAIIAAVMWAADQGANVINLSLGGAESSEAERQAFQYARDRNVLPFCAAGNEGRAGVLFPAAYPECVAVSATDWGDDLASYSNWGPDVELAAPGGDSENGSGYSQIASTCFGSDTNYCLKAGTSMASPQAAGLATLLYALGLTTPDEVLERLRATADDLGEPGRDERFGHGRINAWRAVQGLTGGTANVAPTADFGATCSGTACTFTDLSSDPDGTVVSWSWTFGDGVSSTERNPSHAYSCTGSHTVALTVTDDDGATGFASRAVTVAGGAVEGPGAVADPAVWLEARAVSGIADGQAVATWPDRSGNCRHATQVTVSKRPLYQTNRVNGLPVLFFDGTDDGMSIPVDPAVPVTVVAVYASRAGTAGYLLNGGSQLFMGPYVSRYRNYTRAYANGPTVQAGRWVVHTLRQSSGRAELWIDGVFQASVTKTADPTGLWLAREGTYGKILDGYMAEVLVYGRALSNAELQSVHDELLARYSLPTASNQAPTASFNSSCTNLVCSFTDASTDVDGTVATWSWSFGDGTTSTTRNPTHTYAAAGTYTVTLGVTDDDRAPASTSRQVTVTAPGGGGPFVDPSSVPGLGLWLRADGLVGLADGDAVAAWTDVSGAGRHATQAVASKRPTYRADQIHALPALTFDASDDGMATPLNPGVHVTIFVVYASRAAATGYVLNGGFQLFMGPYVSRYRNYTGAYANGPSVSPGRWLVQTLRQSTSVAELFVDGVFQVSVTKTADPGALLLGAQGTYGRPLDGALAEVIVYDRALNDVERADVEGWLRAKYGLP
jgi:PKD repeat protein